MAIPAPDYPARPAGTDRYRSVSDYRGCRSYTWSMPRDQLCLVKDKCHAKEKVDGVSIRRVWSFNFDSRHSKAARKQGFDLGVPGRDDQKKPILSGSFYS